MGELLDIIFNHPETIQELVTSVNLSGILKDLKPHHKNMLYSLLIMVQMRFSFMLTDKDSDMRMCKHCKKAFIASRKGNEFCSQKCKNQYNIYKSREKKKGTNKDD